MVLAYLCCQDSDLPAESRSHVSGYDFILAQAPGIRLQRILEVPQNTGTRWEMTSCPEAMASCLSGNSLIACSR